MSTTFPKDFLWGTATASYQVEGAINEDGRTPSIWDTFCAKPGTIIDGSSGEFADDHYHRFAEDIAIMRDLGVKAYRLSIAWPRIIPHPDGAVNQRGIDHYVRVLDALREADITPSLRCTTGTCLSTSRIGEAGRTGRPRCVSVTMWAPWRAPWATA